MSAADDQAGARSALVDAMRGLLDAAPELRRGRKPTARRSYSIDELTPGRSLGEAYLADGTRLVGMRPSNQAEAIAWFAKWAAQQRENERSRRMWTTGFLYFAEPFGGGEIKIGKTSRPKQRMRQLELSTGRVMVPLLVTAAPCGLRGEKAVHRLFAAHRAHGEWFRPAAPIFDFITNLRALSDDRARAAFIVDATWGVWK